MLQTPFEKIQKSLSPAIPQSLLDLLPKRWEKIGNVLVLKLDEKLINYEKEIGKAYAEILHVKTVLHEKGAISGVYRKPNVKHIFGLKNTEVMHIENGVRYKLDVSTIMFSSGNMDERLRMANISKPNEIVVDLFAGIGYFTLPMAVYSKPHKIFSCEINPISYEYLCQNIVLNHVTSQVEPILGDNRVVAPKNVADRVVMGYFDETERYLPVAFGCLKNGCGIIHYHTICSDTKFPDQPFQSVEHIAKSYGVDVSLLTSKGIKSYAPGVIHGVLDISVER